MFIIFLIGLLVAIITAIGYLCFIIFFKSKDAEEEKEKRIPTTQDHLPFEYIRASIVKLKGKGYRLVVEVPSINIDLMEAGEKQSVMEQYRSILNSIDFKFQILQQSRIVDISEYIDTLDTKKKSSDSKFVKNQLGFYIEYLNDLVKYRSVLTKKFYVVIPYEEEEDGKKDYHAFSRHKKKHAKELEEKKKTKTVHDEEISFEKAQKQLYSRGKMIERSFKRFEIEPHILDDQELLELYYTAYNKDRSVYQSLRDKDPSDYTTLWVKEESGVKK